MEWPSHQAGLHLLHLMHFTILLMKGIGCLFVLGETGSCYTDYAYLKKVGTRQDQALRPEANSRAPRASSSLSEPKCSPIAFQRQSRRDKYEALADPASKVFVVAR